MSHEIRTPLNAVIGLTHLCLQTELNGQQQDYLKKISLSANALLSLLNDILDFSKIEAGMLSMEETEFSIEELLGGVVAIMSVKSQEKDLELLIDTGKEVPSRLEGDSHRLGQILTNLVGNATKFTERGEIVIKVEVVKESQERVTLQFSVRDSGIGMTSEQMGELFKKFSQADSTTTRKYGGTGLGLAISKHLVEMMGGQISADSSPGHGSRFIFSAQFGKIIDSIPELPVPPSDLKGLKILVVDDNDSARKIISAYLESMAWQPLSVDSGERAIETIISADTTGEPFDLILLDWKMPGLDGLQLTHQIKHELPLQKSQRLSWYRPTVRKKLSVIMAIWIS